ncbi:SDR family oxidoreductase [Mesorhizobium escarrei]|uniref:NmrA family transcriptional regulator n=1 Tax=Mesorhizobium escarrei TaxID=666018 RepID=A0ABM9DPH1_9HYPH|nr:SDR family oxidoreductase [Mesorhizobium escarrei]CAH2398547.1 NmrA family transcriptional regulator [Mesorhizobium escarrei]
MKIVVIGGTGLIGSKTVERLSVKGHDVIAASPNTGVNTITGQGLTEALAGAQVVIDLANSPSFEESAVLEFFETSGRNLLAVGKAAGVKHHIALSVVGAERLPKSAYLRAKMVQERLIRESGIPYTIVHSTQFFEFLGGIAQSGTVGDTVTVSSAYFQPIASDDVADFMADVALSPPINSVTEIAGPEPVRMNELVARFLMEANDPRKVLGDPHALYFGTELDDRSLVPGNHPRIGAIRFEDWFSHASPQRH